MILFGRRRRNHIARRMDLGDEMSGVRLVAALPLLHREAQRFAGETFSFVTLSSEQMNLAALDDNQRQSAQPAHRLRGCDRRVKGSESLSDIAAARTREPQIGLDRRTQ